MGANEFFHTARGATAKEAFAAACRDALYDYGHRGYTGTIAEKDSFVMITKEVLGSHKEASDLANDLLENDDDRITDKWGPAGCIPFKNEAGDTEYLFFGWASS